MHLLCYSPPSTRIPQWSAVRVQTDAFATILMNLFIDITTNTNNYVRKTHVYLRSCDTVEQIAS